MVRPHAEAPTFSPWWTTGCNQNMFDRGLYFCSVHVSGKSANSISATHLKPAYSQLLCLSGYAILILEKSLLQKILSPSPLPSSSPILPFSFPSSEKEVVMITSVSRSREQDEACGCAHRKHGHARSRLSSFATILCTVAAKGSFTAIPPCARIGERRQSMW